MLKYLQLKIKMFKNHKGGVLRSALRNLGVSWEAVPGPSGKQAGGLSRVLDPMAGPGCVATNQQVPFALSKLHPKSNSLSPPAPLSKPPPAPLPWTSAAASSLVSLLSPQVIYSPQASGGIFWKHKQDHATFLVSTLWKLLIPFIMTSEILTWPKTAYVICSCWPFQPASSHHPSPSLTLFPLPGLLVHVCKNPVCDRLLSESFLPCYPVLLYS